MVHTFYVEPRTHALNCDTVTSETGDRYIVDIMTTNEFHVEVISRVEKRYHRRFEKSENEASSLPRTSVHHRLHQWPTSH